MSHHQNAGKNHNIRITNKFFESMTKFKFLRMTVTACDIHDEIKNRLNLENACCHSVLNILSFHLLSKELKIRIYEHQFYLLFYVGVKPDLSP
jgi:hypothetical protein